MANMLLVLLTSKASIMLLSQLHVLRYKRDMAADRPPSSPVAPASDGSIAPPAKFKLGDRVRWYRVPTQDFGVVVDRFHGTEGSVKADGWHYVVQLDAASPSFAHCKLDYGFEDDLESIAEVD